MTKPTEDDEPIRHFATAPISYVVVVPGIEIKQLNGFAWSMDWGIIPSSQTITDSMMLMAPRIEEAQNQRTLSGPDGVSQFTSSGSTSPGGIEAIWQHRYGKNIHHLGGRTYPPGFGEKPYLFSGFIPANILTRIRTTAKEQHTFLRPDAAASITALGQLLLQGDKARTNPFLAIARGYMSYGDQVSDIKSHRIDKQNLFDGCDRVEACPAGSSDHGWGICIDFEMRSSDYAWSLKNQSTLNKYGWVRILDDFPNHWKFVGNQDWPAYLPPEGNIRGT